MEQKKYPLSLNIQYFAASFTPDNVLMQDAVNGQVPTETATEMVGEIVQNSAVMQLAKAEEMTSPKKVISYLAGGVGAYWVGEGEKIQTSKPQWLEATIEAKKLGVIIPVSKEFLKWNQRDFFNEVRPLIAEAFYTKFDQAALFGTNTPYAAGHNILAAAAAAGNSVAHIDSEPMYQQLNGLVGLVEDAELDPDAIATVRSLKQMFRGELDTTGRPIFTNGDGTAPDNIVGLPIAYVNGKSFDKTKALAFAGDWDYARFGILQDFEYSISTDATLSTVVGEDGKPINLYERDLIALRVTAHFAFMVLNDDAFSALTPDVTP